MSDSRKGKRSYLDEGKKKGRGKVVRGNDTDERWDWKQEVSRMNKEE